MAKQASSLRLILSTLLFLAGAFHASPTAAQTLAAQITYPTAGATNVDTSQPIQWTAVAGARSYYLYVGTTVGAQDLVDSGEVQSTSYVAAGLPTSQIVFARLWTDVEGSWRFVDSSFTAGLSTPTRAVLTSPIDGAVNVDPALAMRWTAVANAQAYYLFIGSTVGANDLVNTGEVLQTSYVATGLPAGKIVFVRLWTKGAAGVWRYSDTTFSSIPSSFSKATLIYPPDGASAVDQFQQFTWTSVVGVQAYFLYVGSTRGGADLFGTDETHATSFQMPKLPAGVTIYTRLWTLAAGQWSSSDTTFTAAVINPEFVFPRDSAFGVDTSQPFRWISPPHADAQELHIGTSAGASDVFNSGQTTATSVMVNAAPGTGVLYARVLSRVNGEWRHTDIAFTPDATTPASSMLAPYDGQAAVDTAQPFEWSEAPLARAYHLTIGSGPGMNDLHDSGEIQVTRRFVPGLPIGPLFGRLQTKIGTEWRSTDFTFTVAANNVSSAVQIANAFWATDRVRRMSLTDNLAFSWTPLARMNPRVVVNCADYAAALLVVVAEQNIQLPVRRLDVTLNPNDYDSHTLAEMFDPASQRWLILDPTFGLTVTRTSDGSWATAEDISTATHAQRWGDVSYKFLGDQGDAYARGYYLDYPLLFVNIYHAGQFQVMGQGDAVMPYMVHETMPPAVAWGMRAIGCTGVTQTTLWIDGAVVSIDCAGVDGLSYVFGASAIAPTAETATSTMVYRPMRNVF